MATINKVSVNGTEYDIAVNAANVSGTATQSAQGMMSADDKKKLDGITASADSVTFVASATSGNKVGDITINGTKTAMYSPTQTSVSGNAGTATKLASAKTIRTNLASTNTASFDGSANVTPGVTGTLPLGNGGTGATTAAGALTNLGLTATAAELNYMDGVTSNVQTQINALNSNFNELGKSVADGKSLLATTVSGYGYLEVASDATFEEINTGIKNTVAGTKDKYYCSNGTMVDSIISPKIGTILTIKVLKDIVIAGGASGISVSQDGRTWTKVTDGPKNVHWLEYGDGIFVASGGNGVWWSEDGLTWTQNTAISTSFVISELVYMPANKTWYGIRAVATTTDPKGMLVKCTDIKTGIFTVMGNKKIFDTNGTTQVGTTVLDNFQQLCRIGNRLYTCRIGANSSNFKRYDTYLYSEDYGDTWYCTDINGYQLWGMCCEGGIYYCTGIDMSTGKNVYSSFYSYDGKTWTVFSGQHNLIHYYNGMWICLGYNSSDTGTGIQYSYDGVEWFNSDFSANGGIADFIYSNGVYLAISSSTSVNSYFSFDGKTWTPVTFGSGGTATVYYKFFDYAAIFEGLIIWVRGGSQLALSNACKYDVLDVS